jgi:hypothetical protein
MLPSFRNNISTAYPTPSSLKSVNPTAASATKRHTHHSRTNRRTEPSASPDQFRFLRTYTCKRTDKLLRTHTEEPRRTLSARETTLRVVLEIVPNASKLLSAHQALEPETVIDRNEDI